MKPETLVKPRKSPKQERSLSLVGSVLEATTRLLSRYGYDKTSTNRVAETAGVSIGSLYQYFPGKDALIAAVLERQVNYMLKRFEADAEAAKDLSQAAAIEAMVQSTVEFYFENMNITSELFTRFGQLQKTEFILSVRRQGVKLIADMLVQRKLADDETRSAYVIANAIMGVILVALIDKQAPLNKEQLAAELSLMVKRYLKIPENQEALTSSTIVP